MKLHILLLLGTLASCWSPTDSYAPGPIDETPEVKNLVRNADSISPSEAAWIIERNKVTDTNLISFLKQANLTGFDPSSFVTSNNRSIKIGLAFSGGGYRAMLCGAGQLSALDSRTNHTSGEASGLSGLLQASTYLAGLSGGNWLVGTIALNNFTSVQEILDNGTIWDLTHSIINYGGINFIKTLAYYLDINDDIDAKRAAGYPVSFTDVWARALSHQFFAGLSDYGASLTWSTLQELEPFVNHEMPFPVVVTDGREPGTTILNGNSTIFEVNPFELGSWDPSLHQFTQVKYLGTNVTSGLPNNGTYIGGMDNAGFIMGTSSSLFNQFLLQINTTSLPSAVTDVISSLLKKVAQADNDIAVYQPNPFFDTSIGTLRTIEQNNSLYLVDGGEDLQNVPLYPLTQPERGIDVIFAYDNSADTNQSWPDGASLVATYERQFTTQGNGTVFPYVPDVNSFRNLNLTAKPTFFGCDAKNLSSLVKKASSFSNNTDTSVFDIPLVIYTANRPFSYWSNTSTYKMSYTEKEKRGMIKNGYEVASRLNSTLDTSWPACVACAIIRRTQERQGEAQLAQCQACFSEYCWDGLLDASEIPPVNFTSTGTTSGEEGKLSSASGFDFKQVLGAVGVALLLVLMFVIR